jgi:hypothetical protein
MRLIFRDCFLGRSMDAAQLPIGLDKDGALAMPLAIPTGSETWEASVRLPTTAEETARVPLMLRAPARIVQMRASVIVVGLPLLITAQLREQFWVKIDVDNQTQLSTSATVTTNAPTSGNFVTLGSYNDRLMNVWACSPTPEFGFVFKSKQGTPGNSGFPLDVILSMTLIGYYVDADGEPIPRRVSV